MPPSSRADSGDKTEASAGAAGGGEVPTWDEVVRTRTAAGASKRGSGVEARLCVEHSGYVSERDYVSERAEPIVGWMGCLERLEREMALAIRQQRRAEAAAKAAAAAAATEAAQAGEWSERWYGRWTWRWQVVTVLGRDNAHAYERAMGAPQTLGAAALGGPEQRRRVLRVVPLDRALVAWRDALAAYAVAIAQPGLRMTGRYIDRWRSGEQARSLGLMWRDVLDLGAFRLIGRMAGFLSRMQDGDDDRD